MFKEPTAYVLINRNAKALRSDSALYREQCRANATVLETLTLAELAKAADLIATEPGPVVLCGGDGTHSAGLTALARAFGERPLPPVALAPGGTVNTVARAWGMGGDPVAYTRRLLGAVSAGTAARKRHPTLRVQLEKNRRLEPVASEAQPHVHVNVNVNVNVHENNSRLAFIVGAGLVSRFFEVYEARGANGPKTASLIVATIFAGSFVGGRLARRVLAPQPCELLIDGDPAPFDRVSLLCASVVPNVGLGLKLLYRAAEREDRFHIVATPLGPRQLGPQMPRVLAGRSLRGPRVDALAATVALSFPTGGAVVIDGDLVPADAIRISAGPVIDVSSIEP
jgi:diacylglycerol kinase family enzyme